jgi:hypothetical protein
MKIFIKTLFLFLLTAQICFGQQVSIQSNTNIDDIAVLTSSLQSTNKYGLTTERTNQARMLNTSAHNNINQSLIRVVPESLEVMLYTGENSERKIKLFNTSSEPIQCSLKLEDSLLFLMGQLMTFDSGTLPAGLELAGSAYLQYPPGQLVLTTATGGPPGGLFTSVPFTASDIEVEFDFCIQGGSGADGLTLCFLDDKKLGEGGGDLGLRSPTVKGWALEFDTWQNWEYGDLDANHAAIVTSDLVVLASNSTIPIMQDNGWFHCEFSFHEGTIEVYLQNESISYPRTKILTHQLEWIQGTQIHVGFTGATGGYTNYHIIDNVIINVSNASRIQPDIVSISPGDSALVTIKFDSHGLRGGYYYEKLVVVPDSNESARVEIPIHMFVESAPDISLKRTSDFGRVLAGSREINNLQVKNSGFEDLYISNCLSLSGNFRPLLLSFILREGEVRSIPIECLATSKGTIEDTLIIESNDPDEPIVKVSIKALVITAPSTLIAEAIEQVSIASIQQYVQELEAFGTRDAMASNRNTVREYIKEKFLDAGITSVSLDSFQMEGTWQANVVATLVGSSPGTGEIIVGGHYDSRGYTVAKAPGADDNASGVAAVMEIARVLNTINYEPKATIRFVAFAAEEYGLLGSYHFAHKAQLEGRNILLMQNFDMIAYRPSTANDEVYVIKYDRATFEAEIDSMLIADVTNLTPVVSTMYFYDSDSYSFEAHGFPAVFNIEYQLNPNLHTDRDSSHYLDFEYASDIVRSGLALLLTIDDAATNLSTPVDLLISEYTLYQNYPNPFNPSTTIKYSIPELSKVKLTLFNLLGEEVTTLVDEERSAGNYSVEFNASNLPSGVYFYQLMAGEYTSVKKMLLIK